jgi:eukaryotic-like serine/threonine-protein kinase
VATEAAPQAGRLIAGRYELRSVIGRGGAGTVWQAEDVLLKRMVAVKEVNLPATSTDEERHLLRERVLREARAAAAVRHPVLVTVFDVVDFEDRPWLVLELIEARTLAAHVAEQTLTPAEAARVGIDLLAALRAVHRAGIQHRDVKPGNVLLEDNGRPRLTDFGIASTAGDPSLTSTGVLLGSPSYLPPERARGGPGGPESDLWGLAATLYTAVEGRPPYDGPHPLAVLTAVVEGRRRPAEHAGDLEPLLADLLDRAPEDRPDADEVRERLVAVAGDLGGMLLDPNRNPGVGPPRRPVRKPAEEAATDAIPAGTAAGAGTGAASRSDPGTENWALTPGNASGARPGDTASLTAAGDRPASDETSRRPSRRRLALGAAAALLALLLVGGAVLALGRSSSSPSAGGAADASATPSAGAIALAPANLDATAASAATPPGWVRYTDPAGWSVAHPAGWSASHLGQRGVDFVEPGTGSYLHVETAATAPASVLDDWMAQEKLLTPRVSNYARVAITPADGGDGSKAADWEFSFGLAGSPLHAQDRGLAVDGTGYSLYWQTPAPSWTSSQATLAGLFGSFAPAA